MLDPPKALVLFHRLPAKWAAGDESEAAWGKLSNSFSGRLSLRLQVRLAYVDARQEQCYSRFWCSRELWSAVKIGLVFAFLLLEQLTRNEGPGK